MTIKNILVKYWGYSSFRPLQEDIINSVLEGRDTLALLPTGGGKSICFQVPTMAKQGICIVITPLIALMKDQVESLKKKHIKAVAIYSGMHHNEIDLAINNCLYNNVKFLYLSPERLETDLFRENLRKMNVCLLAVDEAHCISQWGYDFRPPYLKIANIRQYIPEVPIIALTATATPDVVNNIQEKLKFNALNVFQKSFERKNLTYVVLKEEDKYRRLLKIVNNVKGSGIIYVRNRRKTREISVFLMKNKISSDYYHAGLNSKERDTKQNSWMSGKIRIIVSTNAFGMGIDKPNVRFVVHFDVPDSLEAYFQEAGRAGRDSNRSYAVLLYEKADIIDAQHNISITYPELKIIKNIYQALGNYYQLAVGSGKNISFDLDIIDFCKNYKFTPLIVYNSLKFLEKEGYILLNDVLDSSSKIHFKMNKGDLYKFQVENVFYDNFIKIILRSYSGVFNDFIKINETEIANRTKIKTEVVVKYLQKLEKLDVLTYLPRKSKPQLVFSQERINADDLYISNENYKDRKNAAKKRLESVINYATSLNKCRCQLLLAYFGETDSKRCGKCDVCIERNKIELSELEFDIVLKQIKPLLKTKAGSIEDIANAVKGVHEDKIIKVVQWLLDNDKIIYDNNKMLHWNI
ncbi:MAG: RecQ family ATP-dependent DNA helicase [Bacteroidales bacterium]|nr:RecQ family ATP-dependent DNA helicase [Bacteroidales bacterium]